MQALVQAVLDSKEVAALRQLIERLSALGKPYFLRNEILQAFENYCDQTHQPAYYYYASPLGQLIHSTHEILLEEESVWLLLRTKIGSQEIYRSGTDFSGVELMTPQALLNLRDRLVDRYQPHILEIDLEPFNQGPSISDPQSIGQGVAFLNHYLCEQLYTEPQYWLEVLYQTLSRHQYDGIPLLINEHIYSGSHLVQQLKKAIAFLSDRSANEPYEKFHLDFQELGFEPGWGNSAVRVRETLELLNRLIDSPKPTFLEAFVARIPAIFRIVLISIHGWVGQEGVMGRSETAGQVAYVLDQARSLEQELREEIQQSGLALLNIQPQIVVLTRLIPNCQGTECDLPLEKVRGTEHAWILRVPFPEHNPNVTRNWISKSEIWPYLEGFADKAEQELLALFKGRPNLIVGNYTDGNLVAFLLARRLKVAHCHIAHSLEKSKHLYSALYWQDLEAQHHFSVQFTADLIGMNAADFIVTSSYQEILGTPDTAGQYESYKCFTMPQLYHVLNGIDLFNPKFNVVPPGFDENIFFPYNHRQKRVPAQRKHVYDLLFTHQDPQILGSLDNLDRRPIFAVALIEPIKNLTGLAQCFGQSQTLQERCNLILVAGKLYPDEATNWEERQEIEKLHDIINQYHLHGRIRWLGMPIPRAELGEAYRAIADCQGIFVHPARFAPFGLTILEAAISGLPSFTTQFGGSWEIIEDGQSGFHINPIDLEKTAEKLLWFIDQCDRNPQYWYEISERAIERVRNKYSWRSHAQQLLILAKIYSFWNSIDSHDREALLRYLEALFYLIYRPRAEKILEQHQQR